MKNRQMKQMKQWMVRGAAIAALVVGTLGVAHADVGVGLKVARGNACMGCHAVDRKLVDPSFRISPPATRLIRRPWPSCRRR